MAARFQNLPFKVSTTDGRNVTLLSDVFYLAADGTRYCLPAGTTSDGASTPREIWPLLPPFGPYWPAAVLHDASYRNTLLVWNGAAWTRAALPREKCDALLLEALEALGVGVLERQAIFEGVVLGGSPAFNSDRNPPSTPTA